MRLIDADELITAFPCGESVRTESVRATINHMPTIEIDEDCISREQMTEAIDGVDWYHVNSAGELELGSSSNYESWYRAEDIYKAIESLPSVAPSEAKGEWVEEFSDDGWKWVRDEL